MHSPYLKKSSDNIKCLSKNKSQHLEKYYTEMLGMKVGNVIFDRTLKYCGMFEGWHLNGDAADVFGLLNSNFNIRRKP
tara:strand:+ start:394 stop:627 length:234 start_codon:yes stop_codon:yes gene_type:complete